MSADESDTNDKQIDEEFSKLLGYLEKDMDQLFEYRDMFFEHNPLDKALDKNGLVKAKMNILIERLDEIDENDLSIPLRAGYSYMKGRTYNVNVNHDVRAIQCLNKALKLNPSYVEAWNELGECYWKNMNIKDAKNSFEGALKIERNKIALRCMSIILRQDITNTPNNKQCIQESVEMAKEAVALDYKDGMSWSALGNAYMCQFFLVAQDPATLKACLSAYRKAENDPVARGQPDLHYNKGLALKYDEQYSDALEDFTLACQLDPTWAVAADELRKLVNYLKKVYDLVRTRGRIKAKKVEVMVKSIDLKMLGPYKDKTLHTFGERKGVLVRHCQIDELTVGVNEGKVILGKVVGSIHNENAVPFTFAIVDSNGCCAGMTVYNWADGRGVIIGDCVVIPEPLFNVHNFTYENTDYKFKTIRVNNPTTLLVNGKRIGKEQFAGTRVTSSYEIAQ